METPPSRSFPDGCELWPLLTTRDTQIPLQEAYVHGWKDGGGAGTRWRWHCFDVLAGAQHTHSPRTHSLTRTNFLDACACRLWKKYPVATTLCPLLTRAPYKPSIRVSSARTLWLPSLSSTPTRTSGDSVGATSAKASPQRSVYQAMTQRPPGVLFTSGKVTKKKFDRLVRGTAYCCLCIPALESSRSADYVEADAKLQPDTRATDYLRVVSKYPLYGTCSTRSTCSPWVSCCVTAVMPCHCCHAVLSTLSGPVVTLRWSGASFYTVAQTELANFPKTMVGSLLWHATPG